MDYTLMFRIAKITNKNYCFNSIINIMFLKASQVGQNVICHRCSSLPITYMWNISYSCGRWGEGGVCVSGSIIYIRFIFVSYRGILFMSTLTGQEHFYTNTWLESFFNGSVNLCFVSDITWHSEFTKSWRYFVVHVT